MKRILALLLVFATIFAFAACKKTDKDDNGTTTGGSQDAVVDVSADDTSDGSESSLDSTDGTKASTTGTKRTPGKKSNIGTNTVVKPSHNPTIRPTKHKYVITVQKGSNGMAEIVTSTALLTTSRTPMMSRLSRRESPTRARTTFSVSSMMSMRLSLLSSV